MGRQRRKPIIDVDKMGVNPLTVGMTIPVNRKLKKVTNKYLKPDLDEQVYESTPFCKVFEIKGYKQKMIDLPIRCKELLLFLIHSIDSATDYIWIDRVQYMKQNNIKSENTFRVAVNELAKQGYIYKVAGKNLPDVYWINPLYFFKGSRIKKYENNVRVINTTTI